MVFKLIQKIKLKLGRFRQNQNLTLNFRNTAWLFIEKIIRMVVGFFVGVWVARYLGPEQFGIFSYAQSFAGLFIVVAALGLDSVVVRELVKDESSGNEIMATAFWLKILGALVALLMLVTAVNFTSGDLQTNILVFIIASSVIFQSFNVVDFYFQAKVLSKYIAYVNIISLFLSSIVKIVLIVNNESLISFAWVVLFDSFILAVGFIYVYVKRNSKFRMQNSKFKIKIAIDLFKKGLPLIFAGAITVFIMRIDQVMIQEIKGSYDVGIYAASVKVTEIWYFIAIVISNSLFPFLINSKNKSNDLFLHRFEMLLISLYSIALTIIFIVNFYSYEIINVLFGRDYIDSAEILVVQVWTTIFVFLGFAGTKFLLINNFQKQQLYRSISALIINIILNYPLITLYGGLGAAYATLISWIFSSYVFHLFNAKTRSLFVLETKVIFLYNVLKVIKNARFKKIK